MAESMQHDAPNQYNPVKAHEYYLRTRELKGRQPGATVARTGFKPSATKPVAAVKRAPSAGEIAAARGQALHMRLDSLKILLRELLRNAHDKNAKKDPAAKKDSADKTATGAASGKKQDRKPLMAAEKADKAAKAKEAYRKDHPQTNADQIKAVRAEIHKIEQQLRESVARAKAIAGGHHTATGSTTSNP